ITKENMTTKSLPPSISAQIRERIIAAGVKFHAGSNISSFIGEGERELLINEVQEKFEAVLDSLLIDRQNDPNSQDTGRRLAKMYINELFEGRFDPPPSVTAFPNTDSETRFKGVLVAHS